MESAVHDLRYAFRQFVGAPGVFAVAILTLALGIGANTALFSYLTTTLRSPMAGVRDAESLVWVSAVDSRLGLAVRLSRADFEAYRSGVAAVEELALILDQSFAVSAGPEPEQLRGQAVCGHYFQTLRAPFALGRGFVPADDHPGSPLVTVISHRLWERQFQSDPAVIGRTMFVNRLPHTIIGVAPEGFVGAERGTPRELWVTMTQLSRLFPAWGEIGGRNLSVFRAIGRLSPGATAAEANAQLAAVAARLAAADPADHGHLGARTSDASSGLPPNAMGEVLQLSAVSLTVTGLILLIACANVSNLLLARGVARRREVAVRLAIGAGRARIVRQLLTESLLLSAAATVLGLLLALWTFDVIASLVPELPVDPIISMPVLLFSSLASILVAAITGIAPAWLTTGGGQAMTLKATGAGGDRRRTRLQSAFVVSQVALSLVLLVMAGLVVRSLDKATRVDLGFDASSRVLAATFDLGVQPGDGAFAMLDRILESVGTLPGVTMVSATSAVPTAEVIHTRVSRPPSAGVDARTVSASEFSVRPGYFSTIGIPLRAGRDFQDGDRPGAPGVVIVNESLARRLWPAGTALGEVLVLDATKPVPLTVVGIAADSIVADIESPRLPAVYLPHRQHASMTRATILVRAESGAASLHKPVRDAIASVDPMLPVTRLQTMDRYREQAVEERRVGAGLLAAFGLLGLALAAVGIAGAMTLSVNQRTREIGVRLALGAAPGQVVWHFVARSMRLALVGIVVGLGGALAAAQLLASMLFGITAGDTIAYAAVSLALGTTAALACWLPARRAARVDPLRALAAE